MAQTVMDLEKYFERDIVEFLNKQRELQDSDDKHPVSEMLTALKTNNVALASQLLEEAIQNYNKLELKDIYKEVNFKKILEMYSQAKEFITLHPQPSKLKADITILKNSGQLEKGIIPRITVFEEKLNKLEEAKLNALEQEKDFSLKLDEKIRSITKDLAKNIIKKDASSAIKNYKELKNCFDQYPSSEMEKKQEIHNDLLSFFTQINKLRAELNKEKINLTNDVEKITLDGKTNTDKYLRLEDIKSLIGEINLDVKRSDFNAAAQKIMELKQTTSKIPDQYKHIRTILNSKIDIITQRVDFVKRINTHN
ncbi:MAG: hypothetical protein ACP5N2_05385 [Candidatus Nanoarchaeia archaeon]